MLRRLRTACHVCECVCVCVHNGARSHLPDKVSPPPHPASGALARQSSLCVIFTSLCLGVGLNTIFIGSPHGQMTREKGASVEGAWRRGRSCWIGCWAGQGKRVTLFTVDISMTLFYAWQQQHLPPPRSVPLSATPGECQLTKATDFTHTQTEGVCVCLCLCVCVCEHVHICKWFLCRHICIRLCFSYDECRQAGRQANGRWSPYSPPITS